MEFAANTLLILVFLLAGKLSANAQLILTEKTVDTIDNYNFNIRDYLYPIKKLSDKNIIMFRHYMQDNNTGFSDERYDSLEVSKYSTNGVRIWSTNMALPGGGRVYEITEISGIVYASASIGNTVAILQIDESGNISTLRSFNNPGKVMQIERIAATRDNHILLVTGINNLDSIFYGYCGFPFSYESYFNRQLLLTEIDLNGNILWHKLFLHNFYYGGLNSGLNDIEFYVYLDILEESDNSFNIITYYTEGYDSVIHSRLFHLDDTGQVIYFRDLQDNLGSNIKCLSYQNPQNLLITDTGYLLFTYIEDLNYSVTYKTYNINKAGEFLDSSVLSNSIFPILNGIPENHYTNLHIQQQGSHYFALHGTSGIDIFKTDRDYSFLWEFQKDDTTIGSSESIYFTSLSDTSFLLINRGYDSDRYSDITAYLKFYTISTRLNQLHYAAYIDRNLNGIKDMADTSFENAVIEINDGMHSNIYKLHPSDYNFMPAAGTYDRFVPNGTYTSRLLSYDQQIKYYDISPATQTSIFNTSSGIDSVIFRMVPKPEIQDLQISLIAIHDPKPGEINSYGIQVTNAGTKTIYNYTLKFLTDPRQDFTGSFLHTYTRSGDTVVWNLDSIPAAYTYNFVVQERKFWEPLFTIGDTLTLFAGIYPIDTDAFSGDNTFYLKQAVRSSFDPNDKTEIHEGHLSIQQLNRGDYLYYTIRFQNTGNTFATNIIVKDTLSDNLDWNTLEMVSSSHAYSMQVSDRRYITWTFNDINLPDSGFTEEYSHGYISFRIRPKAGLNVNDVISNRASILFDFNPAIVTNTANTRIITLTSANQHQNSKDQLIVFPNPSMGQFTVKLNGGFPIDQVQLFDVAGKTVYEKNTNGTEVRIDAHHLAPGIYLLRIATRAGEQSYKILVE